MPVVTTCTGYVDCFISSYARLWRLLPGIWIDIFLPMPAAPGAAQCFLVLPMPGCDHLCGVYGLLNFYLCKTVTTCAGYVNCYISTYASCDDLRRVCRVLYFYLSQAVTTCTGVCRLFYFYLCQTLTTFAGNMDCYISTYASCAECCSTYASCVDLCRVCRMLSFYLYQAMTTCARYVDCYISTSASCDDLCWGLQTVIYLPKPATPNAPSFVFLPMPTVPGYETCAGYVDC